MGYGYSSRRFSYESPVSTDVESDDIDNLIISMKDAIDNNKLKDAKSVISKLKLSINPDRPLYTEELVTFTAYIYAKKAGSKKVVDSLHKVLMKKNFTYDGIAILKLIHNLSKSDFQILLDDYFTNPQALFNLDGTETIKEMFKQYPQETNTIIQNNKLNKFAKGEARTEMATLVISEASEINSIIVALTTYFGVEYVDKFGVSKTKIEALRNALNSQPLNIIRSILSSFFYIIYINSIPIEMLLNDIDKGLIDDATIKQYISLIFKKSNYGIIEILKQIESDIIRAKMITSNTEVLNYISSTEPSLLPSEIKDVFLF